jgi:hypothetical protein
MDCPSCRSKVDYGITKCPYCTADIIYDRSLSFKSCAIFGVFALFGLMWWSGFKDVSDFGNGILISIVFGPVLGFGVWILNKIFGQVKKG